MLNSLTFLVDIDPIYITVDRPEDSQMSDEAFTRYAKEVARERFKDQFCEDIADGIFVYQNYRISLA